jgi:elongation factor P--(R)-beta-lysine ligase
MRKNCPKDAASLYENEPKTEVNTILRDRAEMLAKTRAFFAERLVLEVDTPVLSLTAPIATHIDVMRVEVGHGFTGYLHTSPEYAMKRLLARGIGDIYQLSHVFRQGEMGPLHNPEFTMLEWYRLNLSYEQLMEETLDLIRLFLGPLRSEKLSYGEALKRYAAVDWQRDSTTQLYEQATSLGVPDEAKNWKRDTLLNLLFSFLVEPHLGKNQLTVICDYPASQAALAKVEGEVARRFEIYAEGIELANGYDELTNAKEQCRRFIEDNEERVQMGKAPLPIDEAFLAALEEGLPDCRGVAVGFDRLMLLRHGARELREVLSFAFQSDRGCADACAPLP